MATTPSFSLVFQSFPFNFRTLYSPRLAFFPRSPFHDIKVPHHILSCSSSSSSPSPRAAPATEQEILKFVAESDEKVLPCVRSYENDLAGLSLVGTVAFEQALTAAAADGGRAADEHIDSGIPAMVVETVVPIPSTLHATSSTRLFLPARKVKEKANKLRRSLSKDMLSGSMSRNILAMTFRQVILQELWNFELVLFKPGSERDMENLENGREVPVSFTLSSSDEQVISVLAEVVCACALQSTETHFIDNLLGRTSSSIFKWFQKRRKIKSKDSSVVIYRLFDEEIVESATSLLGSYNAMKGSCMPMKRNLKNHWWTQSAYSKLEKIGGPEFGTWTSEYVPAYRLEIDASKLMDINFEGWRKSTENRWEVLITHSQMAGLADALDMYFEDVYSLPNKRLPCNVVANHSDLSSKKKSSFLLKMMSATVASAVLLVAINALAHFWLPHQRKEGKYLGECQSLPLLESESGLYRSLGPEKVEAFCTLAVKKVKDAFDWPDNVVTDSDVGAWIGEVPSFLKTASEAKASNEDNSESSADLEKIDGDVKTPVQDIASYQVTFSGNGEVVGFQPTSRVGVNHWASNPLAKELYRRQKLSPGFLEPGLKIPMPTEVVVIELLMSVNADTRFALARPAR